MVRYGSSGQNSRIVAYNIDSNSRLAKCSMTIACTYLKIKLTPICLTNEMIHALLQLAVLHRAAVEYFGKMI